LVLVLIVLFLSLCVWFLVQCVALDESNTLAEHNPYRLFYFWTKKNDEIFKIVVNGIVEKKLMIFFS